MLTKDEHQLAADWSGRDDPDDPHNWALPKKLYHTFIPTSIAFLCSFSSSVYTPGRDQVQSEFGISEELALLPFILYLLGMAFGPLIAAPSSETFGRRAVYQICIPISAMFNIGAGFSQNSTSLIVCRFFAGLFSSPGMSVGTGAISDLWTSDQRGVAMAAYFTMPLLGPAMGPLIGGFVVEQKGWRWTQWTILLFTAIFCVIGLGMRQTYKTKILKSRAKKVGLQLHSEPQRPAKEIVRLFVATKMERPISMLCTEKIVGLFSIYVAFNFGLLNCFFAAFPYVFKEQYNFDLGSTGLSFLGLAVGCIIGFVLVITFDAYHYKPQVRIHGASQVPPEQRLYMAMVGACCLPTSLFWFGWTARYSIHWISPIAAEALFGCGNLLVFLAASLYITDCYGAKYGASAWSGNTMLRYLVGAVFPLFTIQMYEGLGIPWATSLLGFLNLILVPIPFAFFKWGPRIRANIKYTAADYLGLRRISPWDFGCVR